MHLIQIQDHPGGSERFSLVYPPCTFTSSHLAGSVRGIGSQPMRRPSWQWAVKPLRETKRIGGSAVSDTDSFIDEVSEEVRRDRLYGAIRRYGWIAVAGVVAIVGGASYNEYNKAQQRVAAQSLGDGILAAMEAEGAADRAAALTEVTAANAASGAVLTLQRAAELEEAGDAAGAAALLDALAIDGDVAAIYRQIAGFKAVLLHGDSLPAADRRAVLDGLVQTAPTLRILAEEQLALLDLETGETGAALERLERIVADAEASAGLRRRASQLIVALGGDLLGG